MDRAAALLFESGARFTTAATLFKDVLAVGALGNSIDQTVELLNQCADLEEEAFGMLETALQ